MKDFCKNQLLSIATGFLVASCSTFQNTETIVVDPLEDDIIIPENLLYDGNEANPEDEAREALEAEIETEEDQLEHPSGSTPLVYKEGLVCVKQNSQLAELLSKNLPQSTELPHHSLENRKSDSDGAPIASRIPPKYNKRVQMWIDYFTNRAPDRFKRYFERGSYYRQMIEKVLAENSLPKELYYLAMIESGFATKARSHAGAVGIWQFMRGTGKRFGLSVNYYLDERQDPIRATTAATKYLSSLYRVFQDWELALAAYNTGEGRVLGAIMRAKTRDFWTLYENRLIPRETRDYVPKFYAAMLIGENPEKYGMTLRTKDSMEEYASVNLSGRVPLRTAASMSKIPYSTLKKWNPHIRRGITPGNIKSYKIWLPAKYKESLVAVASELKKKRVSIASLAKSKGNIVYRVKRGDTLQRIARRHGTTIRNLKAWNGLRNHRIFPGQKIIVVNKSRNTSNIATIHKVRRGQSLNSISKKYGVRIAQIKRWNGLRSSRIYPGQKLKIGSVKHTSPGERYTVRRGDNLSKISKRFNVSIAKLKRKNGLRSSRIKAGQVLIL